MLRFRLSISAVAAGAALVLGAADAHAAAVFGSAVFFTARDCTGLTATQVCGSHQPFVYKEYAGGAGQAVNYHDSSPAGDFVSSSVSFGDGALPTIRQADAAVSNYRVNVNAFAYNSFTNTSGSATELSYAGDLHIVNSSGNPLGGNPEFAGGSAYFSWVAIWDPSLVSGLLGPADVFNNGLGNYDCTTAGVLGFGYSTGPLAGGEQSIHMSTASCSGSPIMINPGQQILAVEFLQTPVNRGGFVDASHTFTMNYDPDLPADVRQNLVQIMDPGAPAGLGAVPEPASWALMVVGFGAIGALLRRRQEAAVA
jgi:hypothetical protein